MKHFLALSLFIGAMALSSGTVSAAGGFVVTPHRVVFEKNQKVSEVIIANRGDTTKRYRISVVNKAMLKNGKLEVSDAPAEGEFFAKDHIRYSPRQITLGPKESQKVRIMSRLKNGAADGEYRSHLLMQELPDADEAKAAGSTSDDGLSINVQAIFGLSIPIILRKGDLSAEVELSTPKIEKEGENTFLYVDVNRKGTKSVLGTVNVFADSQKVGILKGIAVYLSTPTRVVSIKLDPEHAKNLSGKNIRVTFGAEEEREDAPDAELSFVAP